MDKRSKKSCGSRLMSSDPTHINYYHHVLRNGTSHWATDPKMNEWMLTIPRYARYFLNHPYKQKNKTQGVFGAFEERYLPNPFKTQTMEYQQQKRALALDDYVSGVPTLKVLREPDVIEAFSRIEQSVPVSDPRREQTINRMKREYIRERATKVLERDDQGRILQRGVSQAESAELERLKQAFIGGQGRARGQFMSKSVLMRLAELMGLPTTGTRKDIIENIISSDSDLRSRISEPRTRQGNSSVVSESSRQQLPIIRPIIRLSEEDSRSGAAEESRRNIFGLLEREETRDSDSGNQLATIS